MNQNLKGAVYGKGTRRQANFIADIGGMTNEERCIFFGFHEGKPDDVIMDELGMDRKTFKNVEDRVRVKVSIAIFECINYRMQLEVTD